MEPLPEERSDLNAATLTLTDNASMEPLPEERSDRLSAEATKPAQAASMEPLPEERSDGLLGRGSRVRPGRLNGAAPGGAERFVRQGDIVRIAHPGLNGAAPGGAER